MTKAVAMKETGAQLEVRLSLVLYGGLSLAVYLSGACKELLAVVRATARTPAKDVYRVSEAALTEVELAYRKIAESAGPNGEAVEVVVDVLSGTSAGGLNALFLARALATGGSFDPVEEVWAKKTNFDDLVTGLNTPASRERMSVLDNDYFWETVTKALQDQTESVHPSVLGPLVDEVDCFVTATDARGIEQAITLDPKRNSTIAELRRRVVFHFRESRKSREQPPAEQSLEHRDLSEDVDALAFAARATSAFPLAFEATQWDNRCARQISIDEPAPKARRSLDQLKSGVPQDPTERQARWLADGGLLDNKPFEYAIGLPSRRTAVLPVDRKLFYMEPKPDRDFQRATLTSELVFKEATTELVGARNKENIVSDLAELSRRNAKIAQLSEQVAAMRRRSLADVIAGLLPAALDQDHENLRNVGDAALDGYRARVDGWKEQTRDEQVAERGWGASAREGLRWSTVLADVVRTALTVDGVEPDAAVVAARAAQISPQVEAVIAGGDMGANAPRMCLSQLDWSYRFRRFSTLEHLLSEEQRSITYELRTLDEKLDAIDAELEPTGREEEAVALDEDPHKLRADRTSAIERFDTCRALRSELNELVHKLRSAVEDLHGHIGIRDVAGPAGIDDDALVDAVSEAARRMVTPFAIASGRGRGALREALRSADAADHATHAMIVRLIDAWLNFSQYDEVMIQVGDGSGSELDVTPPIRVSPMDATHFVDESQQDANGAVRKLGGTNLHNFGGFLSADWRMNDFTWGRFDMAEMIVRETLDCGREEIETVTDAILSELVGRGPKDPLGDPLYALLNVNQHQQSALHNTAQAKLASARMAKPAETDATRLAAVGAFRKLLHQSDSSVAWNVSPDLTVVDPESKRRSLSDGTTALVTVLRERADQSWLRGLAEVLGLVAGAAMTGLSVLAGLAWVLLAVGSACLVFFAMRASVLAFVVSLASIVIGAVLVWLLSKYRHRRRKPVAAVASLGALVSVIGLIVGSVIKISAVAMALAAMQLLVILAAGIALKLKLRNAYRAFGKPSAP